jgi:hypothetical protein
MRSRVFCGRPRIFCWWQFCHVLWASDNRNVALGARPHLSRINADCMGHVLPHHKCCERRSAHGQRSRGHAARVATSAYAWFHPKTPQKAPEETSVVWQADSPGVAHGQGKPRVVRPNPRAWNEALPPSIRMALPAGSQKQMGVGPRALEV